MSKIVLNYGTPAAQEVLIDNVKVTWKNLTNLTTHRDELTGERAFDIRVQQKQFSLIINSFKIGGSYHNELKSLYRQEVVFFEDRNGEPDKDLAGNVITYTVTEINEFYVDEVTFKDGIELILESGFTFKTTGVDMAYIFNSPLNLIDVNVNLLYTNNFKLTSNQLNTIQDIATTSTPTFLNVISASQASQNNHLLRADRAINTAFPLIGGGNLTSNLTLSLGFNSTNLRITSNQLNTIQDIAVTSTPTFAQILVNQASIPEHVVRADRVINTNAPLIGGGNLTSNLTLSLGFNSTNLRITGNLLNTIQDIATTSSPNFANLTLSGIINANGVGNNFFAGRVGFNQPSPTERIHLSGNFRQEGNASLFNNFTSGFLGSGWRLDHGVSAANESTFEADNLFLRGSLTAYELIINQIRATNGSLFVTSAGKLKAYTFGGAYHNLTFEDPSGHNVTPFAINDVIMCQRVNLNSTVVVKRIVLMVAEISGNTVFCDQVIPMIGSIDVGDEFVRIYNTTNTNRQGGIYLTSDDSNAPFIDIWDKVTSWGEFKSYNKLAVRLGRLNGIIDPTFGALSGYGLLAKGGVYLTSGSTTGIIMRVDESVGRLSMLQNGNTIFDFNTATQTALIAGWNIDTNRIFKGVFAANYDKISINATTVGSGQNHWEGNNLGKGFQITYKNGSFAHTLTLGEILTDASGNPSSTLRSNWWGIQMLAAAGNANPTCFFQLSGNNNSYKNLIAGWEFDHIKLFNGNVKLESSSSLKGLEVTGRVKIGEFNHTELTNSLTNMNLAMIGFSVIDERDTGINGWHSTGLIWSGTQSFPPNFNVFVDPTLQAAIVRINENGLTCDSWDYQIRRPLTDIYLLMGRRTRLDFNLRFVTTEVNTDGGLFRVLINYRNSVGFVFYQQVIHSQVIQNSPSGTPIFINRTGVNGFVMDLPYMKECTRIEVVFAFSGGGQFGVEYQPMTMDVTNFVMNGFSGYQTHISQDGFEIYNSPLTYVKFAKNRYEIAASDLTIGGLPPVRFHGRVPAPPTANIQIGDIYVLSTNNVPFICTHFDVSGSGVWRAI